MNISIETCVSAISFAASTYSAVYTIGETTTFTLDIPDPIYTDTTCSYSVNYVLEMQDTSDAFPTFITFDDTVPNVTLESTSHLEAGSYLLTLTATEPHSGATHT